MAIKVDIHAPQLEAGTSALVLSRWLKGIGQPVLQNEPIAELMGAQARAYVHAPAEGTLSEIFAQPGQNILAGHLLGRVSSVSKDSIDWENFDEVTAMIEDHAEKSSDIKELKDANEALGQLLGVTDNPVFQNMNIHQQNVFLQSVVDESKSQGLKSAAVTQKLLEGLHLRMPANAPRGPTGPVLGMRGPSGPGGMGGGGYMPQQHAVPQPHAYPSYPAYPQGMQGVPPQAGYPPVYPAAFDPFTGQPLVPPPVIAPQQQVPPTAPVPAIEKKEDDKKDT